MTTDTWHPCYNGALPSINSCWIRKLDKYCLSIIDNSSHKYILQCGDGSKVEVTRDDFIKSFYPT
jgi:hypothetical protein